MDKALANLKKEELLTRLTNMDSLLIAFSGGVDSTFLLSMAHQALPGKILAATATSSIHPPWEIIHAKKFARKNGISHISFTSEEMNYPNFVANGPDRCYHCKKELFRSLYQIAAKNNLAYIAHGTNLDDLNDYRPGFKAAAEFKVIAPLLDSRMTKAEIRFLSKEMGLDNWNKPAQPCFATRIPYGDSITLDKLRMIRDAELFILQKGVKEVRVRHHNDVARIEVRPSELNIIMKDNLRNEIILRFRELGFKYISLDLEGYYSGKMNSSLDIST